MTIPQKLKSLPKLKLKLIGNLKNLKTSIEENLPQILLHLHTQVLLRLKVQAEKKKFADIDNQKEGMAEDPLKIKITMEGKNREDMKKRTGTITSMKVGKQDQKGSTFTKIQNIIKIIKNLPLNTPPKITKDKNNRDQAIMNPKEGILLQSNKWALKKAKIQIFKAKNIMKLRDTMNIKNIKNIKNMKNMKNTKDMKNRLQLTNLT